MVEVRVHEAAAAEFRDFEQTSWIGVGTCGVRRIAVSLFKPLGSIFPRSAGSEV
jgi:hypothetical protein